MAADKVSICSNALMMLGAKPISDFSEADDPGIDRAQIAASLWDSVLEQVQRSHPWNCCLAREVFSPDTTPPAFEYLYQFTLPGDCLRVLGIGQYDHEGAQRYKIERNAAGNRVILYDENTLYLRYLKRNDTPASWDAALVTVMTLAMAHAMCYAITRSEGLKQTLYNELKIAWREARNVDGQEDPPQTLGDSMLRASRYGVGVR